MAWQVICADVLDGLAQLPDASVQTVITSPPYWGLRDYGTASWDGGDAACNHLVGPLASSKSTLQGYTKPDVKLAVGGMPYRDRCGKCGAVRIDSQLGLEATPEAYVERMVGVFREVRRVLRPDGTCWLNLGDSYASGPRGNAADDWSSSGLHGADGARYRETLANGTAQTRDKTKVPGLKPKDLVGIPWRVAFALQADGWYLRSDVIWSKPNPMPESVTDRPTKAHEYVFLLTRSARYYYDADAVREAAEYGRRSAFRSTSYENGVAMANGSERREPITVGGADPEAGRNLRSVWSIPTEPYPEAHFATFPKALVVPCVKAGSRTGDTVLDPFAGSGTTGVVALRYGRSFVGIELSAEYAEMARRRIMDDAPLFNVGTEVTA